MPELTPRRIVTGLDEHGRSHLARVEELEPVAKPPMAGESFRVWATDVLPWPLPTDGRRPLLEREDLQAMDTADALRHSDLLPRPNGVRVTIVKFEPGSRRERLHWHDTVDAFFILAGEVVYETDDGSEVTARPGDCVIQQGVSHKWHNRTSEPAWAGAVVMGARRDGPAPPDRTRVFREMTEPQPR